MVTAIENVWNIGGSFINSTLKFCGIEYLAKISLIIKRLEIYKRIGFCGVII